MLYKTTQVGEKKKPSKQTKKIQLWLALLSEAGTYLQYTWFQWSEAACFADAHF